MNGIKITFEDITKKATVAEGFKNLTEIAQKTFPELKPKTYNFIYNDGEDDIKIENDFDLTQALNFSASSNTMLKLKIVDIKEAQIAPEELKMGDWLECISLETIEKPQVQDEFTLDTKMIELVSQKEEKEDYSVEFENTAKDVFTKIKALVSNEKFKETALNFVKQFSKITSTSHYKYTCDGCEKKDFEGIRYQCTVCPNFDYCQDCEAINYETHKHPFIKIRDPVINPFKRAERVISKIQKICKSKKLAALFSKMKEEPKIEETLKTEVETNKGETTEEFEDPNKMTYEMEITYILKDLGFEEKFNFDDIRSLINAFNGNIDEVITCLLESNSN